MRSDEEKNNSTNELIRDYAVVLSAIYDERTAGDYTFAGVLATFLNDFVEGRR